MAAGGKKKELTRLPIRYVFMNIQLICMLPWVYIEGLIWLFFRRRRSVQISDFFPAFFAIDTEAKKSPAYACVKELWDFGIPTMNCWAWFSLGDNKQIKLKVLFVVLRAQRSMASDVLYNLASAHGFTIEGAFYGRGYAFHKTGQGGIKPRILDSLLVRGLVLMAAWD